MNRANKQVLDLPIEKRAEMALKVAVKKAIAERARAGLPSYVWGDGKVVEVSAKELRTRSRQRRERK